MDYAVYHITALVSLLGAVKRVGAISEKPYKTYTNILPGAPEYGKPIEYSNESRVSAIIMMQNGVSGTMHIDCDNIIQDQAFFAVYGTKGILYLTDPNAFDGELKFLPMSWNPQVKAELITRVI